VVGPPEGHLAPGGAYVRANDGSMVAGLFTTWANLPLSAGEHWIIEERDARGVTIRHPGGADTQIAVRPLAGWSASTPLEVRAIGTKGELIRTIHYSWSIYGPVFSAVRWLDNREVAEWRVVDPTLGKRRRGVRPGEAN
jgi:hypothetical protein